MTTVVDLSVLAARFLVTNALAVPLMAVISYLVATVTYSKGLDPDNFVIPIESSLADSITTIALLVALVTIA
jgi:cation transporter-like permease